MGITALAFDFGTKSIGCAVGQSITGTAQALPAFKAQDGIPDWSQIESCLAEWKPDVVVVGLPLNMDGMGASVLELNYKTNASPPLKLAQKFFHAEDTKHSTKAKWMAFQPV